MAAIQPAMLEALKKKLDERYVSHLPPLLGDGNPADQTTKQISRAFSAFAIQALFDVDAVTAAQAVVDDYNDKGLDAIFYDEKNSTLYLLQAKLKANEQFNLAEAQSFISGVRLLLNKQYDQFNQNVKDLEPLIEKAFRECDAIKLVLAYTGDGVTGQGRDEIVNAIQSEIDNGEEQLQPDIIEFGPREVEEFLREEEAIRPVNDKIRVHKYRRSDEPRKAIFGMARVSDLVSLHKTHGKALYAKNIRYFLGAGTRGVNSAIKETLQNAPENFFYLNNGITLVGGDIKQRDRARDNNTTRTYEIVGMSVVNGAQTISTAAQFLEQNPDADISDAQVMVTLIETGQGDFYKQVTKSRNLQNPVNLSNFASLDDTQERLRKEMAIYGVDYHYRPQQPPKAGLEVIRLSTLSKALACHNREISWCARLKTEPSRFTNAQSEEYAAIFTDELTGSVAINSYRVFDAIQALLLAAEKSSPSPEKLVYRHCTYALPFILMKMMKDKIYGREVLTYEQINPVISAVFDQLRQAFSDRYNIDGAGSAHHAFFKRISDVVGITKKVMIKHLGLEEDPAVSALVGRLDPRDPNNQALVNLLAGKLTSL